MASLSTLEVRLLDEYYRCEHALGVHEKNYAKMGPKKYISKKVIGGRPYLYLQWRENGRIRSQYIKKEDQDEWMRNVQFQKDEAESIKNLKRNMKQLEKALGRKLIDEYRNRIRK